jgi:dihydroneopterin aldolase
MFIGLNSIEIFAHHGVYDEEIDHGNHFEIDIKVEIPDARAGSSDMLSGTLDYTEVYKVVLAVSEKRRYNLLETFAYDLCKKIIDSFLVVQQVTIKLRKLNPPIGGSVKNVEVELQMNR